MNNNDDFNHALNNFRDAILAIRKKAIEIGLAQEIYVEEDENCDFCNNFTNKDDLYKYKVEDQTIVFQKITGIQYCPICGKELPKKERSK